MEHFLLLVAVVGAVTLVARHRRMGWLRRALDRRTAGTGNAGDAVRIAGIGTRAPAAQGLWAQTHRASAGVRLLSTALVPVVVFLLHVQGADMVPGGGDAGTMPWMTAGAAALGLWYLAFIWRYAVEVDGTELKYTSLSGGTTTRDLSGLVAIESDRAYMLRLFFEDQRQAEIIALVADADGLRRKLEAHLNG